MEGRALRRSTARYPKARDSIVKTPTAMTPLRREHSLTYVNIIKEEDDHEIIRLVNVIIYCRPTTHNNNNNNNKNNNNNYNNNNNNNDNRYQSTCRFSGLVFY